MLRWPHPLIIRAWLTAAMLSVATGVAIGVALEAYSIDVPTAFVAAFVGAAFAALTEPIMNRARRELAAKSEASG